MVEAGDIEWEEHKPTWGEIPEARKDHFSFVRLDKMYILGGSVLNKTLDGGSANNLHYLDLITWTWHRQKCTGTAPIPLEIQRSACHYDGASRVRVLVGPRWEAGTHLAMSTYTLNLDTFEWSMTSDRGSWNFSWKMDATVYLSGSDKLIHCGRHPVSNFNDTKIAAMYHHSARGWSSWYDFSFTERDNLIVAAFSPTNGFERLTTITYNESKGALAWCSYEQGDSSARITGQGALENLSDNATNYVVAGEYIYFFDSRILCSDRVSVMSRAVFLMTGTLSADSKFVRSVARAPQRPRIGASIVYYDGKLIFFGGAESDSKVLNDVHVLRVSAPKRVGQILDELEKAESTTSNNTSDPLESTLLDGVTELTGTKIPKKSNSNGDTETDDKTSTNDDKSESASPSQPSDDPLSKDASKLTIEVSKPTVSSQKPEDILTCWLAEHQMDTQKLLEFAVNNPDCYPDMAFKVEGQIIWAHKAIVAARSSRWRQLLDPQEKSKLSSPSTSRRSDFDDSELDVSNESAIPKDRGSPSPFMFGKLGSSAIDLMLEEEDVRPKFEMMPLPSRFSRFFEHPFFTAKKPSDYVSPGSNMAASSSSIGKATTTSSDSISPSVSNSGIAPPSKAVPVYTLEDLKVEAFKKVLTYMYTGSISVWSDAEALSDVAHEFLLDDVSSTCREGTAKNWTEPALKTSRVLRRLVGSPVGSDYFFVVRRKKLFAHRFAIFLFSPHFRRLMLSRPDKSYVEVPEVEDLDIPVEAFIDFCRMLYCNFTSIPEHAEKKMDAVNLTKLATDWQEYRCLSLIKLAKPDAKLTLDLYRLAQRRPELLRDVQKTIVMHFSKFVQDKKALKSMTKSERKSWMQLGDRCGATWLDKLWLAHTIGDATLLADAADELEKLINVENVLPVLFCAHQVGAKPLRSACMDFMSAHSTSIEDTRRMQLDTPGALRKVGSLSASVNHELTTKIAGVTSGAKSPQMKVKACDLCSKNFSTFGKKNKCILCHKTACGDCTKKKVTIPPIFGVNKPRDICTSCVQIVALWHEPSSSK